jgi:putative transposase
MPHSKISLWVHLIWTTKYRAPLISKDIQRPLFNHIKQQFIAQGCLVSIINGKSDHIHCLVALNAEKSISEIVKNIKGRSSYYVNHEKLTHYRFSWQRGYAAFSVCPYHHSVIFNYIKKHRI